MRYVAAPLWGLIVLAVLLVGLVGVAAPRALAHAIPVSTSAPTKPARPAAPLPTPPPPSLPLVQLTVRKVERVAVPVPPQSQAITTTPTPGGSMEYLFVSAQLRYSGTSDVLHFYAGDIGLHDASGVIQLPQSCDPSVKLPSKTLIASRATPAAPVTPAVAPACLRYMVSVNTATTMALWYTHTEQAAQGVTPTVYSILGPSVPYPPQESARRVYATATQPAFKAYLLDEALAGGYIALDVDPLYAGGSDATVPGPVLEKIRGQVAKLVDDRRAFLSVAAAADPDVQTERIDVDNVFKTILEQDLKAVSALRTYAQWAQWHTAFTADNSLLASLYDSWPATLAAQ